MITKKQIILLCTIIGGYTSINHHCLAMEQNRCDTNCVQSTLSVDQQNESASAALALMAPYLPFQDLGNLHKTCRALPRAWDHNRVIRIIHSYESKDPDQHPHNWEYFVVFKVYKYFSYESISPNKLQQLIVGLNAQHASNPIKLKLYGKYPHSLPKTLQQLKYLKFLQLDTENLTNAMLIRLCNAIPQLHGLGFSGELEAVPQALQNLLQLKKIMLRQAIFNQDGIIVAISKLCPQIQVLDIWCSTVITWPEGIKFPQLIKLKLWGNNNETLPTISVDRIIDSCPHLQELKVNATCLKDLPYSIQKLKELKALDIEGNEFTPDTIASICCLCPWLRKLNLRWNHLPMLPLEMLMLHQVKILDLSSTYITSDGISLICNLDQLEKLSLNSNKLNALPDEIVNLQSCLKVLDVALNNLCPSAILLICHLDQLETLDLSHNNLNTLPDEIQNLQSHLKVLYLEENPLPPAELERIKKLLPHTLIIFDPNEIFYSRKKFLKG